MNAAAPPSLRDAVRDAARWYARLRSPAASQADRRAWEVWLAAAPEHQTAWREVEAVRSGIGHLPAGVAASTLGRLQSRRMVLRSLAIATLVAPSAWLAYRVAPVAEWRADLRTSVGERRRLTLADGTLLTLDTSSAMDLRFDAQQRLLRLHAGRILVETAHSTTSARLAPFIVETRHGRAEALGTRFSVRTEADASCISVMHSAVRVATFAHPHEPTILHAGSRLRYDASGSHAVGAIAPSSDSWAHGSLVVVDRPLGRLAADLARYRHGHVACDPSIAQIAISGAFPLDDTDRAFDLIAAAFPVRVTRLTPLWVRLSPVA